MYEEITIPLVVTVLLASNRVAREGVVSRTKLFRDSETFLDSTQIVCIFILTLVYGHFHECLCWRYHPRNLSLARCHFAPLAKWSLHRGAFPVLTGPDVGLTVSSSSTTSGESHAGYERTRRILTGSIVACLTAVAWVTYIMFWSALLVSDSVFPRHGVPCEERPRKFATSRSAI